MSSSNAFKVLFSYGDWSNGAFGTISSVDAGLAAKALGGMHTCSNSAINGYKAFPNFNSTFVKNGENWKTVGNLNDYSVDDFATKDTTYSGSANVTTNAYTKYLYVQEMYNTNGNPSFSAEFLSVVDGNKTNSYFIVIIASLAFVSLGSYIILRRKKEN